MVRAYKPKPVVEGGSAASSATSPHGLRREEPVDVEHDIVVHLLPRAFRWLEVDVEDRGPAKPHAVIHLVPDEEE